MFDLFLKNGLVYVNGQYHLTNIGISGEKIAYIGGHYLPAKQVVDVNHKRVLPGFIDPHVHFELYCGTVTSRDDFYYGSKSAAYGGVTTFIDFLDPSRNAKELEQTFKDRLALAKKSVVDFHFHACIREPNGDLEEYVLKMKELGINTVKLFTTYSETHRRTYDKDIKKLLRLSKKHKFLVCAHIENDEMIKHDKGLTYRDLANARPSEAETKEALKLCSFAKSTGGYLYMVHCSSGETLMRIATLYKDNLGKNIFIESCPQYFVFNKNILKSKYGYLYTFAPPLRSEMKRQLLCKYFDNLSTIGTDHCSFNIEDKKSHETLDGHPLGIGGVESSFVVMYEMFGDKVIDKMSKNVAEIECFAGKNGIKVGNFADLVIVSSDPQVIGKPHGKADYSVYQNMKVNSKIVATIARGQFVVNRDKFIPHKGKLVNCGK